MTVITNGDRRAAAEAAYVASGCTWTIKEYAAEAGIGERTAGKDTRRLAATNGGKPSGVSLPPAAAPRAKQSSAGAPAARPYRHSTIFTRFNGMRAVVTVVTLAGATLSYSHVSHLAIAAGLSWHAWVLPVCLDGMVAACLYFLAVAKKAAGWTKTVAYIGVVVGIAGTVAANAIAERPEWVDLRDVAVAFAVFPPVALAVSVFLLERAQR